MAINFDFLSEVLNREIPSDKQNALSELVKVECASNGVSGDEAWGELAYSYKAIVLLAIGDNLQEKIGDLTRRATNREALARQYDLLYKNLLRSNGLVFHEGIFTSASECQPTIPQIMLGKLY